MASNKPSPSLNPELLLPISDTEVSSAISLINKNLTHLGEAESLSYEFFVQVGDLQILTTAHHEPAPEEGMLKDVFYVSIALAENPDIHLTFSSPMTIDEDSWAISFKEDDGSDYIGTDKQDLHLAASLLVFEILAHNNPQSQPPASSDATYRYVYSLFNDLLRDKASFSKLKTGESTGTSSVNTVNLIEKVRGLLGSYSRSHTHSSSRILHEPVQLASSTKLQLGSHQTLEVDSDGKRVITRTAIIKTSETKETTDGENEVIVVINKKLHLEQNGGSKVLTITRPHLKPPVSISESAEYHLNQSKQTDLYTQREKPAVRGDLIHFLGLLPVQESSVG